MKKCEICGRDETEVRIRKAKGYFLCPKHITRLYRYGVFDLETIYSPNEYVVHKDYAEIILRNKNQEITGSAKIDIEDIDRCKKYKWHIRKANHTNYANAYKPNDSKKIQLHRLIVNCPDNLEVDHINHNGLDNRKSNLRIVSHQKNMENQKEGRTGIKRVPSGNYQATVTRNYKTFYIGTFPSFERAKQAREKFKDNFNRSQK